MKPKVDDASDAEFDCRYRERPRETSEYHRSAFERASQRFYDDKARAARQYHRRMRPAAPEYLDKSVTDAAEKKRDDRARSRGKRLIERDAGKYFFQSAPPLFARIASLSAEIASESPPSLSISPLDTAS